ncbi:exonuclease SbcD [Paraburkholderia tropica]|uniref:metallophosphoesterase family protein n=1 Tax=Paraburkholderia tropica TaxID=92647 RepID=UPI001603C224|nr:metallophosphatase family protein [Paraburkholderia tropica]MBB2984240.1 exonuclease SbcD [Paraburkholderia tropica]MBB3004984.1 exonuclease SbcD [Paraburkholderia tropica]MBB6323272.1 exonuclease SbcD [Paraburkholderia tropica]QNB17289.1 metallophosphatase family protein [Paraburkholderia tropica]
MKIAHFSDLHYSPERLDEADRCFGFAVDDAIARNARVAVVSGDSTDHRLDAHSPALGALARQIHRLAAAMPVIMLQGTFSHEPPGTLDIFALMGSTNEVFVADRIQQVAFGHGRFIASAGAVFSADELAHVIEMHPDAVFTCLPTINKGQFAASVGALAAATDLGDVLGTYLAASGSVNAQLREAAIATVGISHGTVVGCETEHGVTMAGFDHEFSLSALFDAQCSAFLLGHIHKHQSWESGGRRIAYPGSIGRFHYGEQGEKGYLLWEVDTDAASADLMPTPSRRMLCVDFDGPPDMERLAALAADSGDAFVRIRWQIDEEHRQSVDRAAIEAMFAHAPGVKIEPRILPIVRSRAQGISLETSVDAKLARWCELTDVASSPLLERLQMLETADASEIAEAVLAGLESPSGAAPLSLVVGAAADADVVEAQPSVSPSVDGSSPDWLEGDLFAA